MAFRIISTKNRISTLVQLCCSNQKQIFKTFNRCISLSTPSWQRVAFHLSDIGEGIREVVVKEWFVKEGDVVEQFDNLCEVQSDKASVTITSRYDGKILKIHHQIDDIALVGKPLIDFDVADDSSTSSDGTSSESSSSSDDEVKNAVKSDDIDIKVSESSKILTTPAVRRIAGENKVNLAEVQATGPNGRILKSDVLEYLNIIPPQNAKPTMDRRSVQSPAAQPIRAAGDRIEKLKDIRKAMFKTMTASLKIPHFLYSDEFNVTELVKLRDSLKCDAAELGVKITFMPFFIKAASLALTKHPILNSSIDEENESVIYKSSHNIGVAMATPGGLVVPNIKNCEQKTILQIARDLNELTERGRSGKLQPDDFQNGTFTLSNIGVVGGTVTMPIVLLPQVAIGGIGSTRVEPRFIGDSDSIQRVHLINVSWASDHRVIDGITIANFSNEFKRYVESPNRFVLQ